MGNAQEFWRSNAARNYPNKLILKGQEFFEPGEYQRQMIGEQMKKMGWVSTGKMLDLGAGPSTKWIFGPEVASDRVWAVDFSPELLDQSGVPQERRVVADLRSIQFQQEWKNKFNLATAVLLFRYLNPQQRKDLMTKLKNVLTTNGRVVLIDFKSMRPETISTELGEVETFDTKTISQLLQDLGYSKIENGQWNLVFEDGGGDPAPFSVDWITAINP